MATQQKTLFASRVTLFLCTCLVCTASCFSRSTLMTYNTYEELQVGTSLAVLKKEVGEPYAIHAKEEGIDEYEYVERVEMGENLVSENHYFISVQDGKVVGKRIASKRPPPYELIYEDQPNYPTYP